MGKWPYVAGGALATLLALKCAATLLAFPAPFLPKGDACAGQTLIRCATGGRALEVATYTANPEHLAAPGKLVVVYSHGNAETLSTPFVGSMRALADRLDTAVVCYDYPGYGLSTGKPNERSAVAALEAVVAHLEGAGVGRARIVLAGRSIGSGPTLSVAATSFSDFAGVCLIAAFTSVFRVGLPFGVPWLDVFDNLARAGRVRGPALLVHGEGDTLIPASHSRELAAALRAAGSEVEVVVKRGFGHNDVDASEELGGFLARLGAPHRART